MVSLYLFQGEMLSLYILEFEEDVLFISRRCAFSILMRCALSLSFYLKKKSSRSLYVKEMCSLFLSLIKADGLSLSLSHYLKKTSSRSQYLKEVCSLSLSLYLKETCPLSLLLFKGCEH